MTLEHPGSNGTVTWSPGPTDPQPVLGRQVDIVPIQKRAAGGWLYLVADHDYAFQVLLGTTSSTRPVLSEVASNDGTKLDSLVTLKGTAGVGSGRPSIILMSLYGPKYVTDVNQKLAEMLEGATISYKVKFVKAHCSHMNGTPYCSAETLPRPESIAMFAAFYLKRANRIVTISAMGAHGDPMILELGDLIIRSFAENKYPAP